MEAVKQAYDVQIAGLPLKIRSTHDAKTVNELIDMVNQQVQKVLAGNPNISFQKAVLLASLHLAEDLVFLKRTAHSELSALENKARGVLKELESSPIASIRIDS